MIEIQGDGALVADFTRAGVRVAAGARSEVEAGGEKVAEHARDRAPKRRPQLAPSITSEMIGPLTAEIGPENALGGGYGHIVEKGLAGRPPQPYLDPALDDAEGETMAGFEKMVGGLL